MPHLSASSHFGMVFKHLWDYFHPKDSTNGFPQLFQLYSHIVKGHIPLQIACVLGVACLLAMTKSSSKIHPITMGEALYQLTSHALCLQFHNTFVTHFSPHQIIVTTKGSCETIVHGIKCTLNLYLDSVVLQLSLANTFNLMSRGVIFQELLIIGGNIMQFIPFVHAFHAFESPLFYSYCNHESNLTIILFAMGTH